MGQATCKGNEEKSKMKQPFGYTHAEIQTKVVVCGPTHYQLDQGETCKGVQW